MAGAGAADHGPPAAGQAGGAAPGEEDWRDWAGLLEVLLVKVAGTLVAQTEADWAAQLKRWGNRERLIQEKMAKRKHGGNCLFVFALVCKGWRKAQLKVGGRLRTRVRLDVLLPGRVALAKWALAEGCPRYDVYGSMVKVAAWYGHMELVQWLCGEGGFKMDEKVMSHAAWGGNLQLVQWLRGEGCPWDWYTCYYAADQGHVEVLRWARENGCPWTIYTEDWAARKLGYTDDFGNLVDEESDDEYGYEDSEEYSDDE